MGLELLAEFGSRGKIRLRCFDGIVAERHKAAPPISGIRHRALALDISADRERGPGNSAPVRKFARPYFTGTTRLGQKRALGTPRGGTVTSVRANRLRYSRTIARVQSRSDDLVHGFIGEDVDRI